MSLDHGLRFLRHVAAVHLPAPLGRYLRPNTVNKRNYLLLLEYPKCGRTWLRFMINQAEARVAGIPLVNTLHGVNYAEFDLPRVRYVHGFRLGTPLAQKHVGVQTAGAGEAGLRGVIFMVREPEGVMVSYYYQSVYRRGGFEGSIDQFVCHPHYGIEAYVDYVEFYLSALKEQRHLAVNYETLRADTRTVLANVLEFCGLDLDDRAVDDIVAMSTFEKMQAFEANGRLNPSWLRPASKDARSRKMRAGGADRPEDHLSAEDLDYVRATYRDSWAFRKLGYA